MCKFFTLSKNVYFVFDPLYEIMHMINITNYSTENIDDKVNLKLLSLYTNPLSDLLILLNFALCPLMY